MDYKMTNEELRQNLKKHKMSGLALANHWNISRQQVYSWLNYGMNKKGNKHPIGKAWQIILTQYFDGLGK